jgi:hypothetical protein
LDHNDAVNIKPEKIQQKFTFPLQEVFPFKKLFLAGLLKNLSSRKHCSSKMSRWVTSGDSRPWTMHKKSVHSTNMPGGRLPTASSALQSARSCAVKLELQEFSQNIKAFPFKINSQLPDSFIRDPSLKMTV